MSRVKRQKVDRASTAAYAASQPLFDTLRNASAELDQQGNHLSHARDIVQSLHVKIANNDSNNAIERHHEYMDAAVKAWHSATETYCEIFQQLVTITAADPTEGREKAKRHEEFVSLLDTARKAEEVAKQYGTASEEASTQAEEDEDDSEPASYTNSSGKRPMAEEESTSQSSHPQTTPQPRPAQAKQPQKPSALSDDIRYDKSGTKVLWQNGVLLVPYSSLKPEEKRVWDVIKKRKMRQNRRAKFNEKKRATSAAPSASESAPAPEIEYEDVSAEVEARLQAREAKKQAEKSKKSEKKRKRESADSFTGANDSGFVNGGAQEEDPLLALEESLKVKPAKKKARKSGTDAEVEEKKSTPSAGTKSVDGDAEVVAKDGGVQANKKRKKSKA